VKQNCRKQLLPLSEACYVDKQTINPRSFPTEEFLHYSIPAFDAGCSPINEQGKTILSNKLLLAQECILFSRLNPRIRRVWHFKPHGRFRAICSTEFAPFLIKKEHKDNLDFEYLKWFLQTDQFVEPARAKVKAATKSRERVKTDDLLTVKILIPPLIVQRKIASILEKADQARRKRQETLRLTDQFLQSAFLEMFGDPIQNPKGWEVKNIEDVCHKVTDGTHDTPKYVDTGIPLITSKNLLPGGLDFSSALNISPADHESIIKRSHPEKDDILFAMIGTIGNATIISTDMPFSIKNVALFKPDKKKILSSYLLMVLRSTSLMKKLLYNSKGGTQKFVALGPLRAIDLPIPPSPEQQRFAALVQKITGFREKQHQSGQELETLFQSLMQKAFRGELVK